MSRWLTKRLGRVLVLSVATLTVGVASCGGDATDPTPGNGNAGEAGSTGHAGEVNGDVSGQAGSSSGAASGGSSAGTAPIDGGAPHVVGGQMHGGAPAAGSPSGGHPSGGDGFAGAGGEGGVPPGRSYLYASTLLSGIQHASVDPRTGELVPLSSSPAATGHLYNLAASEHFLFTVENDTKRVNVHPIAEDGTLPEQPTSFIELTGDPVSIALDPAARFAFVATNTDESIHVLDIDPVTGALSQTLAPLALTGAPAVVAVEPLGRRLYVTRLSVAGILAFDLDSTTGALTELTGSPFGTDVVIAGALVFSPDNAFLFASGSGVSSFRIEESGALRKVEGSPFFEDVAADYFATNLAIEPTGRFLYASAYLTTDEITGFAIDPDAGTLQLLPSEPIQVSAPYSIAIDPSGRFLYTASDFGGIHGYAIHSQTGTLTELSTSPLEVSGLQRQLTFVRR